MPDAAAIEGIRRKFEAMSVVLDERSRRHWAAVEATELGWGGVSAVALATGLSRTTITAGIQELKDRSESPTVSSAGVAEPASDRPYDFVDLEWFQEGWFFSQLHTPFHQDSIRSLLIVIAFINHLLDGYFPFFETHRLFLLDCGIASCDFNRDVGMSVISS